MKALLAFLLALAVAAPAQAYLKAGPVGYGHWLQGTAIQQGMTTSLAAAYSFRKVRDAYAGSAVKLRRTTGGTSDIGFTAGGDFDTAAATAFCLATSCFIDTWYDQSTNARHAVQATAASQPAYVADCIGGKPCLLVTATGQSLLSAAGPTPASPLSISGVAKFTSSFSAFAYLAYWAGNTVQSPALSGNWALNGATGGISAAAADTWHAGTGVINGASSVLNIDGVETTGTVTVAASPGQIQVPAGPSGGTDARLTEVLLWSGYALTAAERLALAENQRNYWAPLPLDTFQTPAAAYSMRRLKSSYSGPGIRLRRASDNAEADIGFLGFTGFTGAPLDVAAAAAHCAATTCSVVTWYDQSGNTRHLVQATAANQPAYIAECNGTLPCARTTTVPQGMASAGTLTPATGVVSFAVVAGRYAGSGYCTWLRENGVANRFSGDAVANQWRLDGGTSGTVLAAVADNAWHSVQATINGAGSSMTVDGATTTGTATGNTVAGAVQIAGETTSPCNFAEHLVWDNYVLTAAEKTALTANQRGFWGF